MPASSILLEVIATTIGDARAAARAGADRIELVTAISEGGLTPSVGVIEAVVAAVPIPVNVIVRPHSRSFSYDASELAAIARDVRAAVAAGANGIVFGMLDAHGDIDLDALRRIADAADGRDLTFHRAFDVARDLNAAFDTLLRVPSVTSVLTSGGHPSVLDARDVVARMVRRAAARRARCSRARGSPSMRSAISCAPPACGPCISARACASVARCSRRSTSGSSRRRARRSMRRRGGSAPTAPRLRAAAWPKRLPASAAPRIARKSRDIARLFCRKAAGVQALNCDASLADMPSRASSLRSASARGLPVVSSTSP